MDFHGGLIPLVRSILCADELYHQGNGATMEAFNGVAIPGGISGEKTDAVVASEKPGELLKNW